MRKVGDHKLFQESPDPLREQVTQIIKQWIIAQYPIGSETFSDLADLIIPLIRATERKRLYKVFGKIQAEKKVCLPVEVWQALKEVK